MEICNKFKIQDKYMDTAERIFLLLFFIYSFLGTNSFTYGHKIITYVMWITFMLGGLLLLYRLINFRSYYKMPGAVFLLFMLASMGISILANYQYAFKENIIYAIYWVFYFGLLYVQRSDLSLETLREKFHFVAALFIIYMTVGVIASYILMITGYNGVFHAPDTNFEYRLGFSIGRLWGIFINPNHAAFSSCIASALLIYFITRTKKIVTRVFYVIDIFLLTFYISMADSRSGAISMGVMLAVISLVLLLYKNKEKRWIFKGLSVLTAAAILVCGFYVPRLLKDAYNQVINLTVSTDQPGEEQGHSAFTIERGYDISEDISNRRFDIWKSAVEIYTSSPKTMILGTSFRGMVPYALEHLPDTYLVNNDSIIFETTDNEFFNILTSQGAIGIVTVVLFAVFVLIFLIRRLLKLKREYVMLAAVLLSIVISLAACAMFSGVMFYNFSQNAIIFWFALGSFIFVLQHGEEQRDDRISD